jgi:hypothetical protein
MKTITTVIATILSLTSLAQCSLTIDEIDEFTGDTKKVTKDVLIGKGVGNLYASIGRINETKALYVKHKSDLGCVSSSSYIIIKWTDGTTTKLEHVGSIDCGDDITFITIVNENEHNKSMEKIRVNYSDYYDDVTVNDKNFLINGFNCVK